MVLMLAHLAHILGCAASYSRCHPSTTKGARGVIGCIKLLGYMVDGMSGSAGGCSGLVCTFYNRIDGADACTSCILGCAASHSRYHPSTTKSARVIVCCIYLLEYMVDGMGWSACGYSGPVCIFYNLIDGSAACISCILGCAAARQLR